MRLTRFLSAACGRPGARTVLAGGDWGGVKSAGHDHFLDRLHWWLPSVLEWCSWREPVEIRQLADSRRHGFFSTKGVHGAD
jgi:hypothetical protein